MAITVTIVRSENTARGKEAIAEVTFDASYPTGGETLDLTAAPFTGVDAFTAVSSVAVVEGPYTSAGAKMLPATVSSIQYDFSTSRVPGTGVLMAYFEDGTSGVEAQVVNATDLSTVLCRLHIVGR